MKKKTNVRKHIRRGKTKVSVVRQHKRVKRKSRNANPGDYGYGSKWNSKWREKLSDIKNKEGKKVLLPTHDEGIVPFHHVDLNQGRLSIRKDLDEGSLFKAVKIAREDSLRPRSGEHVALLDLVTSKSKLGDKMIHWDRPYYVKPKDPITLGEYLSQKGFNIKKLTEIKLPKLRFEGDVGDYFQKKASYKLREFLKGFDATLPEGSIVSLSGGTGYPVPEVFIQIKDKNGKIIGAGNMLVTKTGSSTLDMEFLEGVF